MLTIDCGSREIEQDGDATLIWGDRFPLAIEEGDEYALSWGSARSNFGLDEENELREVIAAVLSGKICRFEIKIGEDIERAGFCEKERIDEIKRDHRDDPMCLGGELTVYAFGGGMIYNALLSEEV